MKLNFRLLKFNKLLKFGFTLAEVLLAVAIVGVIAGILIPTLVTKTQDKGFDQVYEKNVKSISDAVNALPILENVDYFKSSMYTASPLSNYYDKSGAFIRKYMKGSTYCDKANANKCFADRYYKYNVNKKEVYVLSLDGYCAKLRNGASICLLPQIGNNGPRGIIDVNGTKGPNVYGRDLQEFQLEPRFKTSKDKTTSDVMVTKAPSFAAGGTP